MQRATIPAAAAAAVPRLLGALGLALLAAPAPVAANEASFDMRGSIDAYARRAGGGGATGLVPSPGERGYRGAYERLEATLHATARSGGLTFAAQLRAVAEGGRGATGHVDEAYAELRVGSRAFVHAGRRVLAWGQSQGLNPADLLGDPLAVDGVLARSRAEGRVEGAAMAGLDLLFDDGGALALLHAPGFDRRGDGRGEDFTLLRYGGLGQGGALDYAVSAIGGDRPGAGLSLSRGLGLASTLYLDATFREGREKRAVAGVSPDGALSLAPRATGGIAPYATLGFGHTFGNGLALNVEYTRDAAGYSAAEWRDAMAALDAVSPAASALHGRSLGQLNGLLDHYTLRRNYGFLRLAHDAMLGTGLSGELTVLHGLDDGSGAIGLRVEHPISDWVAVGVKADAKYGGRNDEFTLRPETRSLAVYTSVTF